MKIPTAFTVSTTLVFASAPAALAAQGPLKVEVSMPATHTVWYADPMWLGIGAAVVILIIALAFMASKSGGKKSTTTVIR